MTIKSNHIKTLTIENFKSIQELSIDCKKVNVFVGKPNVGKSNILEAISLYAVPYLAYSRDPGLYTLVRMESFDDLIRFDSGKDSARVIFDFMDDEDIKHVSPEWAMLEFTANGIDSVIEISNYVADANTDSSMLTANVGLSSGQVKFDRDAQPNFSFDNKIECLVKPYSFIDLVSYDSDFKNFLLPLFGHNLLQVIATSEYTKTELKRLLSGYGLEMVLDKRRRTIEIQRRENDLVYKIPYSSIADTIRRYIFHLAAIKTNRDSVLLFEEPESHSFPPYIRQLAEEIATDESNQYFIATHSPYLLNTFIQEMQYEDLGIFVTWYEDYQTKARELSKEEVQQISEYGIDLFFNLDAFTNTHA